MSTTTLTPRQLAEIKQSVVDATSKPEQLIDASELAKALLVSSATVDRRVKDGKIPCIRIGNRRRFLLSDVLVALKG